MSAPLKPGFTLTDRSAPHPQNVLSNSARVAEAERRIAQLEEENARLLHDLDNVRSLYTQLVAEPSHESFDERRVSLLKSQIIQLERQNLLLTEMTNGHSDTLLEAENALHKTINHCQSLATRKESIGVSRVELEQIINMLEPARRRLSRMAEKTSSLSKCSKPLVWYGGFLRNLCDQPVSLFDICQGDIEHINLKHVSRLESKLVILYKELVLISNTLQICIQSSSIDDEVMSAAAPAAVYSRLSGQVQHSCDLLQDVCSQLLQLSLLVPAAPLPPLNTSQFKLLSTEDVMEVFGKYAKTRDAKQLIAALVKCVNFSIDHAGIECQLLCEELEFHRAVYRLETQYVEALLSSMQKCYSEFEGGMQEVICQPLGEILDAFGELGETADEISLLHFIEVFRTHAAGLSEAMQKLSISASGESDKSCQFSEYGKQFFKTLKSCHTACKQKRDLCIAKLDAVKQQLSEQTKEVSQIISRKQKQDWELKSLHVFQNMQSNNSNLEQRQTDKSVDRTCRPSKSECICQLQERSTSVDKSNDFATVCGLSKASAMPPVPSPAAEIVHCSSLLPTTSVCSSRDRPAPCKEIRPKRVVPRIVQQSLTLKPTWPLTHRLTDIQSDVQLSCQSDVNDNVDSLPGWWSAASRQTGSQSAIQHSASFH